MQETHLKKSPGNYAAVLLEKEQIIGDLSKDNMMLKSRLAWFERQLYGQKQERFVAPAPPEQLVLDFGEEKVEVEPEAAKQIIAAHERTKPDAEKNHKGRMTIPEGLPRVKEVIEPQEDTSGVKRIGEDVTETLEITPGRMWARRIVRPRCARTDAAQQEIEALAAVGGKTVGGQVVQASLPDTPFPRLKAGVSMLVHILVAKYVDHLPLYRIAQQFARHQIKIPDSALGL